MSAESRLSDELLKRLQGLGKSSKVDPDDESKKTLAASMSKLSNSLSQMNLGKVYGKQSMDAPGKGLTPDVTSDSTGDAFSKVGSALQSLPGVIGQVTGVFQSLVSQAVSFVQVLNPSLVEMMNQAFRDFSATIGVALVPIIDGARIFMRQIGSVLLPIMQALNPVISRLTQLFLNLANVALGNQAKVWSSLIPLADALVSIVEAISPLIKSFLVFQGFITTVLAGALRMMAFNLQLLAIPLKFLADLFTLTVPVMQAFQAIMSGLQEVFFSFANSLLKGLKLDSLKNVTEFLQGSFQTLAKFAILAAAHLAKFFGVGNDFIKGVSESLSPKKQDNTGVAAIQSTSYSNFADFGKNVSLAASKANLGGSDVQSKEEKWQSETLAELKRIQAGQEDALTRAVNTLAAKFEQAILELAEAQKDKTFDRAKYLLSLGFAGRP